jgi:putative (di)nucleoside polyphosphate hydrolase
MIQDAFIREGDEFYRKNVGAIILNKNKEIFVGKRFGTQVKVSWQMPQGGIGENETEEDALFREMEEEIGILQNNFSILGKTQDHHYYTIPKKMRKSAWNNIYVGQRQRWFLLEFKGKDEDFNINTEFPEFAEWKWLSAEDVIENAISFKREIYLKVLIEFNLLHENF